LLADLDDGLTRVRSIGRGELGAVRVGVALLAEATVAPALNAFGTEHPGIVLERSFMLSERLLEQLQEGRLHAVIVHQLPVLASAGVEWEPLRRGPLAVLVSRRHELAERGIATLGELRDDTFLVNPPSLAPGAFEGLKLMCREYGGFDAKVLESTAASTAPLDADWGPIEDGAAIAVVSEPAARVVRRAEIAVVLVQPPPMYAVAVAWRRGERGALVSRLLDHIRGYRDRYGWTGDVGDGSADATVPAPSIYALNGGRPHDAGRERGAVLL
jgi:DNA-binding transcriptional LysR family regulator